MGLILDTSVLLIAVTSLHYGHSLATLNTVEFRQVRGLVLAETGNFSR